MCQDENEDEERFELWFQRDTEFDFRESQKIFDLIIDSNDNTLTIRSSRQPSSKGIVFPYDSTTIFQMDISTTIKNSNKSRDYKITINPLKVNSDAAVKSSKNTLTVNVLATP